MSSFKIYFSDELNKSLNETITRIDNNNFIERIWNRDHTVWNDDPTEISNRLGWLDCPEESKKSIDEIIEFTYSILKAGFKKALLLGMGGSSLAPEVFRLTFGTKPGYLELGVLDSTHPDAVLEYANKFKPEETLYIISTKSGGTIETISLMKYFYNLAESNLGKGNAGQHFIAITDPGSGLQKMAEELKYRKTFLNDPNIGGRFSALSLFGLVPAALIGIDIDKILDVSSKAVEKSKLKIYESKSDNHAVLLGAAMSALVNHGRDKLTLILSDKLKHIGVWLEQLIAESTGKNGKGILPVDGENILDADLYGSDRVFVEMRLADEHENQSISKLISAGKPVVQITLSDIYELAEQFFNWEFATALSGALMGIHPFDQPDVESAKIRAREMITAYESEGQLPDLKPVFTDGDAAVYGNVKSENLKDALDEFLSQAKENSYVSIQAFVKPDEKTEAHLQKFRTGILSKYNVATTLGYGPRFLHSTGQLHKGDSGNGLFIQIVDQPVGDADIPLNAGEEGSEFTFGVLVKAQALGDRQALLDKGRDILRIEIKNLQKNFLL
ncbi:MAG: glucose-6-phosphate isomerase [Ignavibacteriae bacterium]|nr:glucose-6-phosphate isomerase [Ignavibacteriota bacterium]NOG96416.1 glucose-6-phosphate isomerase [Ignavibacteriota bacterium]